ncbi:hypothetical protein I316_01348 [Kwoniella heveanensis BCC8398]|uniref:Uncharacterized protein n=1 Tax=Kwoniella heveanensis BCC8398 TaxID=1296120 RepID=A0A1B9H0E9_9TREE|nr:hypothetical protein I316_01348 [Kwoniella heveanensis BCC8398]
MSGGGGGGGGPGAGAAGVQMELAALKSAPVLNPHFGMPGLPESPRGSAAGFKSRSRDGRVVGRGATSDQASAKANVQSHALDRRRTKFDNKLCKLLETDGSAAGQ